MRLFAAIPIPESESLAIATRDLLAGARGARPAPPGGRHLTLRFFGEMGDSRPAVEALRETLDGQVALSAVCRGVGAFPCLRQARVAWVPVAAPGLEELEEKLRNATSHLGRPPEPRAFRPHVTLARLNPAQDITAWAAAYRNTTFFRGRLGEVVLFRTEFGESGPVYRREFSLALG